MPFLMKGHVWGKFKHKMTYPCRVEVKRDEIRCHVVVEGGPHKPVVHFLSYAGKPLANMAKFASGFAELSRLTGYTVFDTGFEVNGNFDDSYKWVRTTRNFGPPLSNLPTKFILYDLPELLGIRYDRRIPELCFVVDTAYQWNSVRMENTAMVFAENEEEVERIYSQYINAGHEGAMVKSLDHEYEPCKRSYGWLKMKPENDADGRITGFIEAVCGVDQPEKGLRVGAKLGRIGSVTVICEDGSTATPHGIPHELGEDMFRNPLNYLDQWCEFKFTERDRQGGYRHPRFYRLREAKQ